MKRIVIAVILIVLLICISRMNHVISGTQKKDGQNEAVSEPFEIEVSDVTVAETTDLHFEEASSSTEENCRRLSFEVSINNISDQEYKDVWFELALNQEVQPYIASGIITYTSEKMDVTTFQDARENELKNGKPNVCGFTHTWDMLLTTAEDLTEYSDLETQGFAESLKTVTVNVFWDGGQQKETKALHITEKAEDTENADEIKNAFKMGKGML